jgi:hypothetical protein
VTAMRLFETIENKVVHHYIKAYSLMDSFIKLPWYVKLLLSPFVLVIFLVCIFPVVIILGLLYKVLLILFKSLNRIFSNWKLLIISFIFFVLSGSIILISSIILIIFLDVYIILISILPDIIPRLISFIVAPYILLFLVSNSNSTLNNINASIKAISESYTDLDGERKIIEEVSGAKSSSNPLLWIMKSPFTLMAVASMTFIGAVFAVIIVSVSINSSFPDIFFSIYENSINQMHFWFMYVFDQLLIIIPLDIMGPFLPANSEKLVRQPWGGLLSILFQIFLASMAYLYISTIISSAKYFIQKKLIRTTYYKQVGCPTSVS